MRCFVKVWKLKIYFIRYLTDFFQGNNGKFFGHNTIVSKLVIYHLCIYLRTLLSNCRIEFLYLACFSYQVIILKPYSHPVKAPKRAGRKSRLFYYYYIVIFESA